MVAEETNPRMVWLEVVYYSHFDCHFCNPDGLSAMWSTIPKLPFLNVDLWLVLWIRRVRHILASSSFGCSQKRTSELRLESDSE
jgi:hypothetical protein